MSKTEDDYDELWNQDESPWAPTEDDSRGDYEYDVWKQQELDDERDSDSK